MEYPVLTVSNFIENFIGLKRVNISHQGSMIRGGFRISGKRVHIICIEVWGLALLNLSHFS